MFKARNIIIMMTEDQATYINLLEKIKLNIPILSQNGKL